MLKRVLLALLALGLSVALGAGVLAWQVNDFLHNELALPAEAITFEVAAGSSFAAISRDLAERGYLEHPDWYRWYARLAGKASAVHAGEYLVEPGTTPVELLDALVRGDVRLYSFTIVEGWNFRELLAALATEASLDSALVEEDAASILSSIGAEWPHPEGLFLPETYRYPKGTTGLELLRQAHELMQRTLDEEWQDRAVNLPLASPYEALILASIVEKETALASERPIIAGVFTRRLQKGMRLQTDPTVIYGVGPDFDGNLTRRHLRTDTAYNTYTRGGLPPTPIAMPGRAAINAALHPAPGSALFFVATGLGDGSHKFSDTKDEHDRAVQEYLRRQRAGRDGQ